MKTYRGQKIIQCLHFQHNDPPRSHVLVQLEGGSWFMDTVHGTTAKPLSKTALRRYVIRRDSLRPANVRTYDL